MAFHIQEVHVKKTKYSESQFGVILEEADAGMLVKDICSKYGIFLAKSECPT